MTKNLMGYTHDDSYFISSTSTFDQTFQYVGKEELLRGVYYWDSERSIIYLHRHETIEDLINTCGHETIHHCIYQIVIEDDEGAGSLSLDIEQEHDIIRNMAWADFWAVNGYSQINNVFVKTKIQLELEKKLFKKYNKAFEKYTDKWQ